MSVVNIASHVVKMVCFLRVFFFIRNKRDLSIFPADPAVTLPSIPSHVVNPDRSPIRMLEDGRESCVSLDRPWPGSIPSGEPRRRTSFPQQIPTTTNMCNVVQVTMNMVPDLALIEFFDFYVAEALGYNPFRHNREAWIILAHVCRTWRDIVFGSPFCLNVRLYF
jgi:hypothetical protein